MASLERFLEPGRVSLKICGVTRADDAATLVTLGVDALGANFWPHSKRHLDPGAAGWLRGLAGRILRVGVFVNQDPELALRLFHDGLIDVAQLHGDETPDDARPFRNAGVPFFKAFGVKDAADASTAADFGATAVLLDAHAPGVYGGTGATFDWNAALDFKQQHPQLPLVLAGGITPDNAAAAAARVAPAALDVASGAESSPGIKDPAKIAALIAALGH